MAYAPNWRNEAIRLAQLLYLLVKKELAVRYKNSFLGYLWALAHPAAFALVYYVAFGLFMRVQVENYPIFLLVGMFPWVWAANSLITATSSFRNNASLVKRVAMPRGMLPLSNVVHEMVHFCFALPALFLFLALSGLDMHLSWVWQVPFMVLLQLLLLYPFALLFSLANVFVHDVEHLVGIGMSLLFFLTPVVYPLALVPEAYLDLIRLNPFASLIALWRDVFLLGTMDPGMLAICLAVALLGAALARYAYVRMAFRIGELL